MPQIPLLTVAVLICHNSCMRSFLTATEFARIVQRDKKTVIRWVRKGLISGTKRVGHLYQIPIHEVEVFQKSIQYPPQKWQK
jgi:hypothetical protein